MEQDELLKILETLLFITDQPLSLAKICKAAEVKDEALVRESVAILQRRYMESGSSIQVTEIAGGFQMSTKPEYGRWVRKLYQERMTTRLSSAALETLAIIAYKQPLIRAEIEIIRGVEVIAPLETLVEKGLVKVVGRKETVGRPLLYGTTSEFLRLFGLSSLDALPRVDSLEIPKAEAKPGEPELFAQDAAPAAEAGLQDSGAPAEPAAAAEPVAESAFAPEQPADAAAAQPETQTEQDNNPHG